MADGTMRLSPAGQDDHMRSKTAGRADRLLIFSISDSRRDRLTAGAHCAAFLLVSGAIVGISSERFFWYWEASPVDHWVVALYYGLAAAAVLWVIERYRVNSLSSLMLAASIFAYMVEGVITPILYSGGRSCRSFRPGSVSGTVS